MDGEARDIESLTKERNNGLKIQFKPKTSLGKKLQWLQFELENADGVFVKFDVVAELILLFRPYDFGEVPRPEKAYRECI